LRTQGTAVLLVEQLLEKALAAADRVYALVQGHIVLQAPTSEANLPQRLEESRRTSDALLIRVKSTRLLGLCSQSDHG
jgi:ABC-type multidrug transport system ATPase subunit